MIRSMQEYELTNSIISKFLDRKVILSKLNTENQLLAIELQAIDANTEELKRQVEWYEAVQRGEKIYDKIDSIDEIAEVLIGRRIQRGLSQQQFAEELGLQLEEYLMLENDDFYGISKELFENAIDILHIKNVGNVLETDYERLLPTIEKNYITIQKKAPFINDLAPRALENIKNAIANNYSNASYIAEQFINTFKNLFALDLTNQTVPQINQPAVAFKRQVNINSDSLTLITSYAAHISWIVSRQLTCPSKIVKADPIEFRNEVVKHYGNVTFDTCLQYIWDLDIAIIPFDIQSGFHGACFEFESTKVIALNQQTKMVSRWKFDLLHEVYHALTMEHEVYIERTDIMDQIDTDEKKASDFAAYVIFGTEVDSILEIVLEESEGRVEYIKNSIINNCDKFRINVDDFSNYVAYRLGRQISLWGVAANLQKDKRNPWEVTKNILFTKMHWKDIDDNEMQMLQSALMSKGAATDV